MVPPRGGKFLRGPKTLGHLLSGRGAKWAVSRAGVWGRKPHFREIPRFQGLHDTIQGLGGLWTSVSGGVGLRKHHFGSHPAG